MTNTNNDYITHITCTNNFTAEKHSYMEAVSYETLRYTATWNMQYDKIKWQSMCNYSISQNDKYKAEYNEKARNILPQL